MSKDALVAAPQTNQKVYEDSEVTILKVEIKPGQKEARRDCRRPEARRAPPPPLGDGRSL